MLALSEMFPAGCRVQVLTCRRPLFQAASPLWLPAFSLAAWLALAPTRSPTIPVMFGSPSVGIYTFFFFPPCKFSPGRSPSHHVLVLQSPQERWPASWERGSMDPGSSCQLVWWLERGIFPSCDCVVSWAIVVLASLQFDLLLQIRVDLMVNN